MGSQFGANPGVLTSEGNAIAEQAAQFEKNKKLIYETLSEMLTSNYVSPAAKAIGAEIQAKKGVLDEMEAMIKNYSDYSLTSGRTISNNEQNIIDAYTGK